MHQFVPKIVPAARQQFNPLTGQQIPYNQKVFDLKGQQRDYQQQLQQRQKMYNPEHFSVHSVLQREQNERQFGRQDAQALRQISKSIHEQSSVGNASELNVPSNRQSPQQYQSAMLVPQNKIFPMKDLLTLQPDLQRQLQQVSTAQSPGQTSPVEQEPVQGVRQQQHRLQQLLQEQQQRNALTVRQSQQSDAPLGHAAGFSLNQKQKKRDQDRYYNPIQNIFQEKWRHPDGSKYALSHNPSNNNIHVVENPQQQQSRFEELRKTSQMQMQNIGQKTLVKKPEPTGSGEVVAGRQNVYQDRYEKPRYKAVYDYNLQPQPAPQNNQQNVQWYGSKALKNLDNVKIY